MKAIDKIQKAGFKVLTLRSFRAGKQVVWGYSVTLYGHEVARGTSTVSLLRRLKLTYPSYFYISPDRRR